MDLPQQSAAKSDAPSSPTQKSESGTETIVSEQVVIVKDENVHSDMNDGDRRGLLSNKKKRVTFARPGRRRDWLRPYCLGLGLFMTLFAFWLLDSLKDPVFALLVDGNLDRHQPPAKLCSVASTLVLVLLMEFISHVRKQQRPEHRRNDHDVLDPGGRWTSMSMGRHEQADPTEDRVPISIFSIVGGSYVTVFSVLAYLIQFHPSFGSGGAEYDESTTPPWHVLGYLLYACIESFGSISVATFWSYTNSTLSLEDAESFYGLIVAIAQLGAIGGSSLVTTHFWSATTLMLVANLVIVLQVLVMTTYAKRFPPTANMQDQVTTTDNDGTEASSDLPAFWSGVYLILKHRYVMLILGVSCLYEVSLTCLDYQMKLLGWFKFEETNESTKTFAQFMGFYGMVCNIYSLFFSYFAFPFLIHKYGLRITLRFFPTLLLLATVLAFRAVPGNLAVLFVSMTILKAMTYSIHDPSKELLYLPTSLAIKFRSKFWIDVVGARVAKAVGSTINTYAGNVDQSIRVGTLPSLLTATALWLVCYRAGIIFDRLIGSGNVVGRDAACDSSPRKGNYYGKITAHEDDDCLEDVQRGLTADETEQTKGEESIELKTLA